MYKQTVKIEIDNLLLSFLNLAMLFRDDVSQTDARITRSI